MNDDVRDPYRRMYDARDNGFPGWDEVGLEFMGVTPKPGPPDPTQHDRIIALSVLKGHCTTDDPQVQAWVELYQNYAPVGPPLDLDLLMGEQPFAKVAEFVTWEVMKWMDECDAKDYSKLEMTRD